MENRIEFTGKPYDTIKEIDMYKIFKNQRKDAPHVSRQEFSNQIRADFPKARFGRNKQDVVIWSNIRFKQ